MGQHKDWLQSMVFLITPIYNADGNEKFALTNRQRQNGPINGMGTRANAQNLNINRDYMKLDTPEAKAFVKLWNDYDPQVGFDLHTSDGSAHGYYLTYSPPLNPDTEPDDHEDHDGRVVPVRDEEHEGEARLGLVLLRQRVDAGRRRGGPWPWRRRGRRRRRRVRRAAPPACRRRSRPPPAGPREWRTFEHVPRFHNNYVGLRNRFALLSEAYAYATFEDRIKATNYFIEEALNFAHQNAARLKKAVADADQRSGSSA